MRLRPSALVVLPVLLAAIACAPTSEGTATDAPSTPSDSTAQSASADPSADPTIGTSQPADACATDSLPLIKPGTLTIGTDSPAYEPWFSDDDPTNGKGYESAVAYAVAEKLGFTQDQVSWVTVPFNTSYKPGAKTFDFDINQISITPKRAEVVDFSDGYYSATQAVIALKDSPIAGATSIADLADYNLGAQTGTTSLTAIRDTIKPANDPAVFEDTNAAKQALLNGQVDGIVADLPTAFYITSVEIPKASIIGQFDAETDQPEEFGMLLAKGSALTPCVDSALAALKADGTIDTLEQQWLSDSVSVPVLPVTSLDNAPLDNTPGMTTWVPSRREVERRRLRRSMRLRSVLVATGLVLLVFVLLGLGLVSSPGWDRFQATFFSWQDAKDSFPAIARGFRLNVELFLICEVVILVIGLAVAVARQARSPWLAPARVLAVVYVDLFRGVPTVLLVLILGFGVPSLSLQGLPIDPFFWAAVALILSYGAYVAEVFRSGIESIHPSQISSAEALGLSRAQALRFVVVPQAVRRVAPPLLNDFVSLQKDTALVSVVAVFDAVFAARDYTAYNFNYTPYVVVAVFFIALTIPLARVTDWLGHRALERERAGAR